MHAHTLYLWSVIQIQRLRQIYLRPKPTRTFHTLHIANLDFVHPYYLNLVFPYVHRFSHNNQSWTSNLVLFRWAPYASNLVCLGLANMVCGTSILLVFTSTYLKPTCCRSPKARISSQVAAATGPVFL